MPTFQILSLSGGGYRGLYTAHILEHIENRLGTPIADHIDLFAGTSIGGIMALALAHRIPASIIKQKLIDHGSKIFAAPITQKTTGIRGAIRRTMLFGKGLLGARYQVDALQNLLVDIFEEQTIGHLEHRVLVPAVNANTGRTRMFKTPHHERLKTDFKLSIVDVALATSAAPTYFPPHRISGERYLDGGLVANDPALHAVHEAMQFVENGNAVKLEDVQVLGIGTASPGAALDENKQNPGFIGWGTSLFDVSINAQERMSADMLTHWLGNKYTRLNLSVSAHNTENVALDLANRVSTDVLLATAEATIREQVSEELICNLKSHTPTRPTFYHGPNANHVPVDAT